MIIVLSPRRKFRMHSKPGKKEWVQRKAWTLGHVIALRLDKDSSCGIGDHGKSIVWGKGLKKVQPEATRGRVAR